jgi:hypothetical protein
MRSRLAIAAAVSAVWLASAALDSAYGPWGASGAFRAFASAVAIWLISTLVMGLEFRRTDVEARDFVLTLIATIGLLALAEALFWLAIDKDNNKPMLLRLSLGVDAGFVATGLAVILGLWPGRRIDRFQWPFAHWARWAGKVAAGAVVLELALFAFRTVLHGTLGYYAMDCGMSAVAALCAAVVIAALSRCIPAVGE